MTSEQTCTCSTHSVYTKCENGCAFVKTKPRSVIAMALH